MFGSRIKHHTLVHRALPGLLGAALAFAGCADDTEKMATNPPASTTMIDSTPRVALISAFGNEAKILVEALQGPKEILINGSKFTTGMLEGHNVVITLTGVSITNAAMTTQLLVDRFNVTTVLFSGIAGGVDPNLRVGDVVIPQSWAYHDEYYHSRSLDPVEVKKPPLACFGSMPGDLSCLGLELSSFNKADGSAYGVNFADMTGPLGGLWSRNTHVTSAEGPAGGEFVFDFPVDSNLYAKAQALMAKPPTLANCGANACTDGAQTCLQNMPTLVTGGRGLSGSVFLDNARYRQYLYDTYQGRSVDMETAATAQVAKANGKPFIAFRSVSDLAGGDQGGEVGTFFCTGIAEKNASAVVRSFLQSL